MSCFQHLPESCGALHSPCGGAPQQRGPLTPQTQTRPDRLHTHTHPPKRLAHPRSPIPPLSALTSRATHAHPTSPRSTGFCAIWDCISSSSRKAGHHHHRRHHHHHCARRGTRHFHAAEPRRREGWEREGAYRGTRHLRAAEAKKGMLLRGDPDASPTRARSKPNTSTRACRHHPWPAPSCPHPHAPQGYFISGFFIAARSFSNCPTLQKKYAAARGDPDASPLTPSLG